MTKNNYPEGLDELAKVILLKSGIGLYNTAKISGDELSSNFARALLDALAKRGYVLVDAKKQGPVAWISEIKCIGPEYGKKLYGALPIQSLQAGYYKHTPLYDYPNLTKDEYEKAKAEGWEDCETCHGIVNGKFPAIPVRVALPDGWRMVPVEPTEKMRKAGSQHTGAVSATYRDMLSAAPTPPTQP